MGKGDPGDEEIEDDQEPWVRLMLRGLDFMMSKEEAAAWLRDHLPQGVGFEVQKIVRKGRFDPISNNRASCFVFVSKDQAAQVMRDTHLAQGMRWEVARESGRREEPEEGFQKFVAWLHLRVLHLRVRDVFFDRFT